MGNIAPKSVFGLDGSARPPAGIAEKSEGATTRADEVVQRSVLLRWLINDIPYLAMLALAAIGVVLRLPVSYWVIIAPVFAAISIFEGWQHFLDKGQKLGLVAGLILDWCGLLLAIYLLYNSGVQGVLNANAISLAMMTLLALGTFVAGVQARVWQICAVGGVLFLAVPGLGWLDQSPLLLLAAGICVVIVLASLAWWFTQRRHEDRTGGRTTKPTS
jgi:hypothetical protein